jgi:hypothetical protein
MALAILRTRRHRSSEPRPYRYHCKVCMTTREVLILLRRGVSEQQAAVLRQMRVVSSLPPRLVVVEATEDSVRDLRRDQAVSLVIEMQVEAERLSDLRPEEQLFVRSWIERMTSPPKQRPGEGLNWDAPGFEPPDPPIGSWDD